MLEKKAHKARVEKLLVGLRPNTSSITFCFVFSAQERWYYEISNSTPSHEMKMGTSFLRLTFISTWHVVSFCLPLKESHNTHLLGCMICIIFLQTKIPLIVNKVRWKLLHTINFVSYFEENQQWFNHFLQ